METAIILIAFVIIAAAFSFMVVNQGLFATQRGQTVIQQGLQEASSPLLIDGTILVRTTPNGQAVNLVIVPLEAFGVDVVNMETNQTSVMLNIGNQAWANAYLGPLYVGYFGKSNGVNYNNYTATNVVYNPTGMEFDNFTGFQLANQTMNGTPCSVYVNATYSIGNTKGLTTGAVLAIANSIGGDALNAGEQGYLIVALGPNTEASACTSINIEIRIENSATLSVDLTVPASLPPNSYVSIS